MDLAQEPAKNGAFPAKTKRFQWTREQAQQARLKALASRRANKQFRELNPDLPKQPAPEQPAEQPLTRYKLDRLRRVRKQIERIDSMLEEEDDPGKLDRLASASMRLSDQERVLRGEPLPGSLRPATDQAKPSAFGLPPPGAGPVQRRDGQE
jgi:hypothetical protein